MKDLTYQKLVEHYGIDVCNNEEGCVLSPSAHKRGTSTTWRGPCLHWHMNRRVTMPGFLAFLMNVGNAIGPPLTTYTNGIEVPIDRHTKWATLDAAGAMWAQLEATKVWKIKIPATAFTREKNRARWYLDPKRTWGGKAPRELYSTPYALWAMSGKE